MLSSTQVATVPEHRACIRCGYDLFGQAARGRCPECGIKVRASYRGGRREKPKNPQRQAAQLRRYIARDRRQLWSAPLAGVIAIAVAVICRLNDGPVGWYIFAGLFALMSVLGYIGLRSDIKERQRKLDEVERRIATDSCAAPQERPGESSPGPTR
jgi:hypothetical protein